MGLMALTRFHSLVRIMHGVHIYENEKQIIVKTKGQWYIDY